MRISNISIFKKGFSKMIIDFHTHAFPEKIAEKAIRKLEEGMIKAQGELTLPATTDGTLTGLINSMDESGIDISVVMPIATTPSQHRTINNFAKEITDNKRIVSFGSLHPMQGDWAQTLEYIAEEGRKGIKLHPEFQDFYVDEPVIIDIVKKAKELGLYVLFHCGADLGFHPPVKCTPERLRKVIDKCGGENIIAAHLGGFKMWEDVKAYLAGTPILMDTSMTSGFLENDLMKEIITIHGADKFLFGSDSPWQTQKQSLEKLMSLGLSDEETMLITHKNAERILEG